MAGGGNQMHQLSVACQMLLGNPGSPFTTPGQSLNQVPAVGLFIPLFSLCGAAGLRGTFPGTHAHPLFSFLLSGRYNTTSMESPFGRDLNPADLAVVSEECRSSFHHPTVSP
jgi:hypothetical protein